jgi:nucleoside-diphosphate-sugar epimerase
MGKVVVTGAGGYIGTQLVRDLVAAGDEVLAIDRFFFGEEPISEFKNNKNIKILKKDIRDIDENDLKNYDAVCDLACLSNDPAGEIDPKLTFQINIFPSNQRKIRTHIFNARRFSCIIKSKLRCKLNS